MPADPSSSNPVPGGVRNKAQAQALAQKALVDAEPKHDFVILEDQTQEKAFGWVFFHVTRLYHETGDRKYLSPGNGPVIVERETGAVHFLPTSRPPSFTIADWEKSWRQRTGR